jgi:hypothetical protein
MQVDNKKSSKKEASTDWEKYKDLPEPQNPMPFSNNREWPFSVKFPERSAGKRYQLILANGERVVARVDLSRQYASEGKQWVGVDKFSVMAWQEL